MLAGVEPLTSELRMPDSASRYDDRFGSLTWACLVPPRFSRLTEMVWGARGSTTWVNSPVSTESAVSSAPGYNESELAAYATTRSYCWVSLTFWVMQE